MDRNHIQIDGFTEDVMPLGELRDKYKAFNWHTVDVPGHDFLALNNAIEEAKQIKDKPIVIIACTIPGKGVLLFENNFKWHGYDPVAQNAKEDYAHALNELRTLGGKIKSEHQ